MDNFTNTYKEAEQLLSQALEQLAAGNVDDAQKNIELAQKHIELGNSEVNMEQSKVSMLYGESRNFGVIYDVFSQNTRKLYETKKGRRAIAKFAKTIKNNPLLKEQFDIYLMLSTKPSEISSEDYVNEALSMVHQIDINEAATLNDELIAILRENNADELVDIEDSRMALYEAIEYVATNKKNVDNIGKYVAAKKTICENISNMKDENSRTPLFASLDETVEKMECKLNDDEIALIQEVMQSEDKKVLYESYKNTLLNMLSKCAQGVDHATKTRIQSLSETVSTMEYEPNNALWHIARYAEIMNELNED